MYRTGPRSGNASLTNIESNVALHDYDCGSCDEKAPSGLIFVVNIRNPVAKNIFKALFSLGSLFVKEASLFIPIISWNKSIGSTGRLAHIISTAAAPTPLPPPPLYWTILTRIFTLSGFDEQST